MMVDRLWRWMQEIDIEEWKCENEEADCRTSEERANESFLYKFPEPSSISTFSSGHCNDH